MKILSTFIAIIAVIAVAFFFSPDKEYPGKFSVSDISKQIQTNIEDDYSGAILVDLDDDPDLEIFIAGHETANLLLKSEKDKFIPLQIPELIDQQGNTFDVNACDIDQDGRDEILILNHPSTKGLVSRSHLMKYQNKKWVDILPEGKITKALENGYGSSCIDRKGNGKYGLIVTKNDGVISYLELVGNEIKDIASEIGVAKKSKGRAVLGMPSPNGETNILVGNDGPNFYFVNNGDGTFTEKAVAYGITDETFDSRGISHIDLNSDDLPDLVYGNSLGPTRLLQQNHGGTFTNVTPEIMLREYAVNAPVAGDFNLDGYEDLYLNNYRGMNDMFGKFEDKWYRLDVKIMNEKDLYGISSIVGDLDHNGSIDILNTHGDGHKFPLKLYSIKPQNKWIKFLVTYENGGLPRGASVVLRTNKRAQVRVISTGSGRFANYENAVTFGLLKDEKVISSEVILPSRQRYENKTHLELMTENRIVIPQQRLGNNP